MIDTIKTIGQLTTELAEAHQRICKLEALESNQSRLMRELEDSELRYRRLFETAQDGILILNKATGQIIDVNPFLIDMLGYSKNEFVGKYLWEIGPVKDVEASKIAFQELLGKEYVRYEHLPLETRDKRHISVEFVSNIYSVDHVKVIQCNIRDITVRKRLETKLTQYRENLNELVNQRTIELQTINNDLETLLAKHREIENALTKSEDKYRLLVENANEAIFIAQDGMLKFANVKSTELSGYSREELTSMPFAKLVHPDDRKMVIERHIKRLEGGELPHIYPFKIIGKNNLTKWVEISAVVTIWEGRPATLNLLTDITERKRTEEELEQSFKKLQRTVDGAINAISLISEIRDPYISGHQKRTAKIASAIAREMDLSKEQIRTIHVAGILHDIGKVTVPTEILSKPGKLTDLEMALIRAHPQVGYDILETMEFPWDICPIVLQHHERMDGSGYPKGLSGENITIGARILAVADVIEAMASHRPYRAALGIDIALEEISKNKGVLYDAKVVDACLKLFKNKGFTFD